MQLIKKFAELGATDVQYAGGKGASLGNMARNGIPVPPGFVILTGSYDLFIERSGLGKNIDKLIHGLDYDNIDALADASALIGKWIIQAEIPEVIHQSIRQNFIALDAPLVAVRSSASAEDGAVNAWAGQLETYLGTTRTTLLTNIKKCWCSLFSARALSYRFQSNLIDKPISVAVVVQQMVASEVAGVAFSVHPISEDTDEMIIEAGFGLGESVVSGSITPDSYVVKKSTMQITEIYQSKQEKGIFLQCDGGTVLRKIPHDEVLSEKLKPEEILQLAEIIIRIEQLYGFPCDIEWALINKKWYILQCRPITTLG